MPFSQEIFRSIHGAWRIARFDPDAMRHFNLTMQGFWRSFIAAALLAPFFVLTNVLNVADASAEHLSRDGFGYVAVWLLVWFVAWAVFPIVMVPVSHLLKLSDVYVPFIIAWNWSSVLMAAALYPLSMIYGLGIIGQQPAALLLMAVRITLFFYGYLVARASLRCGIAMAIGLVVMEFLISLLILGSANQVIYGGGPH